VSFWCFKNLDGNPRSAEPARPDESAAPADGILYIDGEIVAEAGWFSEGAVVARDFRKALDRMRNVTVRINSPGGDVMAGAEIYSALREHSLNGKGRVKVIITALAASAASMVAMAGDEIQISPVAYMMIHNPWTIAMGDAKEMRKAAKTLDEIREGLITAYQQRTGKTRDQLKKMLENETWMSAQTCVDEGFADSIYGGEIRAAACAGGGMLTKATPEAIAEMCRRWEASRGRKNEDPEAVPEENPEEPEDPEDPKDPEDPEKEKPQEDPDKEEDKAKRAEIARRARILARHEW
jgi:ATP-dependent Clp protease protease subunit